MFNIHLLLSLLSYLLTYLLMVKIFSFMNNNFIRVRSKSLWRWYISTNVMFLDIIHRYVIFLKTVLFIFQNNVSETGSISVFR
jgi:hypothetical protein